MNFNRPWSDYEKGFGDLNGELWYGLKLINCLTQTGQWELKVDFEFQNKTRSYLHYNKFKVGSATNEYPLTVGGFTGITPTDPFAHHNGWKFSMDIVVTVLQKGVVLQAMEDGGMTTVGSFISTCNTILHSIFLCTLLVLITILGGVR